MAIMEGSIAFVSNNSLLDNLKGGSTCMEKEKAALDSF